jgi:outer membrane lipoprotein-sorting protein
VFALLLCAVPAHAEPEAPADAPAPAKRDPAAMSVDDVAACMRANVVDRGSLREIEVESLDAAGGATKLRMKLFWKPTKDTRETRMTLRVVAPADVAGWANLVVARPDGEDVYVYLPALGRVDRVAGGDPTRKLLGTDFTYAEIQQLQGMLLGGTTTRAADVKVFERDAFVLDTKTDPAATGYVMVRSFVDQATCTLLRAELFASPAAPRKVLEAAIATLVEVEPYWLMLGYQLTDRAEGTVTRVKLSDVYLLERLDDALFEPASFHRVEP